MLVRGLKPIDNKHKRIYGLEPYFRQHQIHIREGSGKLPKKGEQGGLEALLYQVYHYPNLSDNNLDCVDALAYQLQVLPPTVLNSSYNLINAQGTYIQKKQLDPCLYDVEGPGRVDKGAYVW